MRPPARLMQNADIQFQTSCPGNLNKKIIRKLKYNPEISGRFPLRSYLYFNPETSGLCGYVFVLKSNPETTVWYISLRKVRSSEFKYKTLSISKMYLIVQHLAYCGMLFRYQSCNWSIDIKLFKHIITYNKKCIVVFLLKKSQHTFCFIKTELNLYSPISCILSPPIF